MTACPADFLDPLQPVVDLNINSSLRITIQAHFLAETLQVLSDCVQWVSCNIFSTQEDAPAGITRTRTDAGCFCAVKRQTLPQYWWCTEQMLTVPGADGCDQLVDELR